MRASTSSARALLVAGFASAACASPTRAPGAGGACGGSDCNAGAENAGRGAGGGRDANGGSSTNGGSGTGGGLSGAGGSNTDGGLSTGDAGAAGSCQTADCGGGPEDSLSWLVQDYVPADPGSDPYCAPKAARAEQGQFTAIHYRRLDVAGEEQFVSFKVRAFRDQSAWADRAQTIFDFAPYFEAQRLDGGPPGASWGGDTYENFGKYVSIVGTSDSGGVAGWYNNGGALQCQYGDAWVSYDPDDLPKNSGSTGVIWSNGYQSQIAGVHDPRASLCPVAGGSALTRWTFLPKFAFAALSTCGPKLQKRMDTIVSDHDGGSHHEVFYFTDEYGFARWERWNCSDQPQLIPNPDYALHRCDYVASESAMHLSYPNPDAPNDKWQIKDRDGQYCRIEDCRDATQVIPQSGIGWNPASWPPSAQLYYTGNSLRNAGFEWSDAGSTAEPLWQQAGSLESLIASDADGNHLVELQTDAQTDGWLSQTADLSDLYDTLGAGAKDAGPLVAQFGLRAWLKQTGTRTLNLALVQLDAQQKELDVRLFPNTVSAAPAQLSARLGLLSTTRFVQLRLHLVAAAAPALRADDVFLVIGDGH